MSDLLAAAAEALSAPAELVKRSAAARAQALGSTVDDVLASWTGGAPAAVVAAPTPAPVVSTEAVPVAEPAPAPVAVLEAEPERPVPVVAAPAELLPVVEPVSLAERVKAGAKSGAIVGGLMALISILFSIQWMLPRASVIGADGDFAPAVE
ncbi:MAG: hypothetical protein OEM66_05995, partial [Acidimicrobiia bacterium]|nr:hypothetical protein [Acidimicrobiia bacterium]